MCQCWAGGVPTEGLSVSLAVWVPLSLETQLWDPCLGATPLIRKRSAHAQYRGWPCPLEVVIGMPAVGAGLQGLQSPRDNRDVRSGLETAVMRMWSSCRASEEVGRPEGFQSQGRWSWCRVAGDAWACGWGEREGLDSLSRVRSPAGSRLLFLQIGGSLEGTQSLPW